MAKLKATLKFCWSVLLLQLCIQPAVSRSLVEYLPGFQGPLPFELETGYIGVGESEDPQLFYHFVRSERNPKEDPLLLWLTGGPGCSAFAGLAFEIGPINFNIVEFDGSLPTLHLNPYSWTKEASILFLDLPVDTGFSYAKTTKASQRSDFNQVYQADEFLRKWLMDHPEFLSNPVYIAGDSYSGIIVPAIVQQISNENEEDFKPLINLQGYILGNPVTDPIFDQNSKIPFAHGMALISTELYESLKRTCGGEYVNVDPNNRDCLNDIQDYTNLTSGISIEHVLDMDCPFIFPQPREIGERRSLSQDSKQLLYPEPPLPTIGCRHFVYLLAYYWMNDKNVHKALHVRERSIKEWRQCRRELPYRSQINSSYPYHVSLSSKDYCSLIYSGDHDLLVPFLGTEAWIKSLNYSIVDDWRPCVLHSQVAGYTRTYSNRMTFATVKGGGHTAPEYNPAECHAMFKRWINHELL